MARCAAGREGGADPLAERIVPVRSLPRRHAFFQVVQSGLLRRTGNGKIFFPCLPNVLGRKIRPVFFQNQQRKLCIGQVVIYRSGPERAFPVFAALTAVAVPKLRILHFFPIGNRREGLADVLAPCTHAFHREPFYGHAQQAANDAPQQRALQFVHPDILGRQRLPQAALRRCTQRADGVQFVWFTGRQSGIVRQLLQKPDRTAHGLRQLTDQCGGACFRSLLAFQSGIFPQGCAQRVQLCEIRVFYNGVHIKTPFAVNSRAADRKRLFSLSRECPVLPSVQ